MTLRAKIAAGLIAAGCMGSAADAWAAEEVNVYTTRQEVLIRPLLDTFEQETGIRVNVVFAKEGVIERMKSEGANSPADAILTADVGYMLQAKSEGLLQPVQSEVLNAAIPSQYRDPEGTWYGLALRARPIMYAKDRVDPSELSTYEDLADPKWKGRICIRSSSNIYNQSLVSSMIAAQGVEKVEEWAKGFVANFAREPAGGDRDQIMAVAAGECDIAIANTYYLAGMLSGDDAAQKEAAQKVAVFWPNQDGRGVHVNISGGGVTASAQHVDNAVKLLEFMVSDEAQKIYAEAVNEYPVKPGIPASDAVAGFGEYKADPLDLAVIGEHNVEAVRLMDRAGWR
ncbi:MAG: iron deficiency-induced protein A [Alphaproteobacteria bacterium]|nr:MAG: iron deficiency-induced protein A [Alphaproteobacteria bacterium]